MFDILTDDELVTLWHLMDDATEDVYGIPWVDDKHGNRKGSYNDLLHDLETISAEINGIRASRSWR